MDKPIIPRQWTGDLDPGEPFKLTIEHDLMSEDAQFTVTVEIENENEDHKIHAMADLTPTLAREAANALMVYAFLADKENRRKGGIPMTGPNHEVERFNMVSRGHPLEKTFKEVPSETGQWVHHCDYEKVEARAEEAEAEVERVRRHEVETAEAALKKVAQAKAQALAEVREAVQTEINAIRLQAELKRQDGPNLKRKRERRVSAGAVGAAFAICDRIEAVLSTLEDTQGEGNPK